MCESLIDLNKELILMKSRLYFFYGKPSKVINNLLKAYQDISCVAFNMEYDKNIVNDYKITEVCTKYNKYMIKYPDDSLLFTSKNFEENSKQQFEDYLITDIDHSKIKTPFRATYDNFINGRIILKKEFKPVFNKYYYNNAKIACNGGRENAIYLLRNMNRDTNNTKLSPYLKFGCVSIRECYYVFTHCDKLLSSVQLDLLNNLQKRWH